MTMHEVEAVSTSTLTVTRSGAGDGPKPGDKIHIYGTSEGSAPARGSRLLTVIETKVLERGESSDKNPLRLITEYWSLEGKLLAEADKFADQVIDLLEEEVLKLEERIKLNRKTFEATIKEALEEKDHEIAALKKQVAALQSDLAEATCPKSWKPKRAKRVRTKR